MMRMPAGADTCRSTGLGESGHQVQLLRNQRVGSRWSVAGSGPRLETAILIRVSSGVSLAYFPTLASTDKPAKNSDGSTDLYFGPSAPSGKAGNWLPTKPGRNYIAVIRLFGPTEAALDSGSL
jgi:hypothetical protein